MTYTKVLSNWQEIYQCHDCGNQAKHSHNLNPCPVCGGSNRDSYVGRRTEYIVEPLNAWQRLLNWCKGVPPEEAPADTWEYKGKQPPMPKLKTESCLPKPRIEQLQLQQDLIELLPDGFDVYLEADKVLVRRL